MKFCRHRIIISAVGAVLAVAAFWVPNGNCLLTPPSRYEGTVKRLKIKDSLGTANLGNLPMTMNLPGRNRIRGRAETSTASVPGFPFDTKIFGKLRTSEIRRGGGKWILTGRWSWKINVNRPDKRGIGRFRSTIVRNIDTSGPIPVFNYDMHWPVRISRISSDPEKSYRLTGTFIGKTNP